ncbi:aldo/keto reductase [Opitutaceae bacterium TAV5]|nr:aldo/keto reductase [Opitutaceae bacterium TAV5]
MRKKTPENPSAAASEKSVPSGGMSRAGFLRLLGGGTLCAAMMRSGLAGERVARQMPTRPIPASGEALPIVGCGTYVAFDVADDSAEYRRLAGVLQALFDAGGSVIDSSPMYGRAEAVTGRLLGEMAGGHRAFLATKVWTSGREAGIRQMQRSQELLGAGPIDLMQIHNLLDWRTHLATLRDRKERGLIRYLGVTHYTSSAYPQLESVLRAEKPDFVQLNYSLGDRAAEERLLPLARDLGVAVIVNTPFGGGGLLRSLSSRPLPSWAAETGAESWAQLLLKFVLGHPAVTCAIPGTGNPAHMASNAAAAFGPLPDEAMRRRIVAAWRG